MGAASSMSKDPMRMLLVLVDCEMASCAKERTLMTRNSGAIRNIECSLCSCAEDDHMGMITASAVPRTCKAE
jgi:hypothetical protein